ncbi:hypothetical protein CD148_07255 [Staphylococcus delphini]|nr:hypothetical protein CD148_07255 [Staphylococcus delphini]
MQVKHLLTQYSSIPYILRMIFLFVGASVCVRLLSDSTSQWTPLSFANSSSYQVCNGLSPSRCYPCQAHLKALQSSHMAMCL